MKTILALVLITLLVSTSVRAQEDAKGMVCPVIQSVESVTKLETSDGYTEISGLTFSTTQLSDNGNPIFYALADGGAGPRLGVFDSGTGELLLMLTINNHENQDWESLALGPCGDGSTKPCLYIADTGANGARETGGKNVGRGGSPLKIIKILEPTWKDHSDGDIIEAANYLLFDYHDDSSPTPNADCEAIFVDYTGWGEGNNAPGDLYLATKWGSQAWKYNRIFKIPVNAWGDNPESIVYSPEAIGEYSTDGQSDLMNYTWTSADMSPDGSLIALGTTEATHLFLRCPGQSVESVLAKPDSKTCLVWPNPTPGQGETFAFMPDGTGSMQIPEGNWKRIGVTKFDFSSTTAGQMCSEDTVSDAVSDATKPVTLATSVPAPGPVSVATSTSAPVTTTPTISPEMMASPPSSLQNLASTTDSSVAPSSNATATAPRFVVAQTYQAPTSEVGANTASTQDAVALSLRSRVMIRVWPVSGGFANTLQVAEEFEDACSQFFRAHFPATIETVTCKIVKQRLLLNGLVLDSTVRVKGIAVAEGFIQEDFDRAMVPLVRSNAADFAYQLHQLAYYSKVEAVEAYEPDGVIPAPEPFSTEDSEDDPSSQSSGVHDTDTLRIILAVVAIGALAIVFVYLYQQHYVGSTREDTAASGDPVMAKC